MSHAEGCAHYLSRAATRMRNTCCIALKGVQSRRMTPSQFRSQVQQLQIASAAGDQPLQPGGARLQPQGEQRN